MKTKVIVGNWKMFKTKKDIILFHKTFSKLVANKKIKDKFGIGIPPIYLDFAKTLFADVQGLKIYAQDAHFAAEGAYTGNVSWTQIKDLKINGSIIGHSERRAMFNETDETVNKKMISLLENKLVPIICVGESLSEYENKESVQVVLQQVEKAFASISADLAKNAIIAYEPIWAIGTGKVASSEEVNHLIQEVRNLLEKKYDQKIATDMKVLYGGSVNPKNIKEFFSQENIDGALVGSASLDAQGFYSLINWEGKL